MKKEDEFKGFEGEEEWEQFEHSEYFNNYIESLKKALRKLSPENRDKYLAEVREQAAKAYQREVSKITRKDISKRN